MKRLDEILTEKGLAALQKFGEDYNAGMFEGEEYLDVHAALRARLLPMEEHVQKPQDNDIDYLVLAICHALGITGTNPMDLL